MSDRMLIGLAIVVIAANVIAVIVNASNGAWWFTPINIAAMGTVVWALHRRGTERRARR